MKIFLLHIPKTGGTSLAHGYLQHLFGKESRCWEGDSYDGNKLISRHIFGEMEHISKYFNFRYCDVFRFYMEQGLIPKNRPFYGGHICYGIHKCFQDSYRYLTLIRRPDQRLASFLQMKISLGHLDVTVDDFLKSKMYEMDNYQVRCLCENGWTAAECTEAMYYEAKLNLVNDVVYGVTERMDDYVRKVSQFLGGAAPTQSLHYNASVDGAEVQCGEGHKLKVVKWTDEERNRANEMNKWDMKLYEFAKETM